MVNKEHYMEICLDAKSNYEQYKKEAEELVVRWEYVSEKRYDLTPYWFERNHEKRGRILKKETDTFYGFDKDGKLRVTYCDELINGIGYTTYSDNQILTRLYRDGRIDSIKEITLEDDHPIRSVEFITRHNLDLNDAWYTVEEYIYEQERLVKVICPQYSERPLYFDRLYTYLEYDENGDLYKVLNANHRILYINIPKKEAVALRAEVKLELSAEMEIIVRDIRNKVQGKNVCFIAIYLHDEIDGIYDPVFHPGLEQVRLEQIEQEKDIYTIWASGEHPINYQVGLSNKELLEKLQKLTMYWAMRGSWWIQGKKLWQEVAYTVNQQDHSENLSVTNDFIFFVDWERFDVKKGGLAKSVPEEKLEILRAGGLLKKLKNLMKQT